MWETIIIVAGLLLLLSSYKHSVINLLGGCSLTLLVILSMTGVFQYTLSLGHGVIITNFIGCFLYSVPLWKASPKHLVGNSITTLIVFLVLFILEGCYLLSYIGEGQLSYVWVDEVINLVAFLTLIITNTKRGLHNGLNIVRGVTPLRSIGNTIYKIHIKGSQLLALHYKKKNSQANETIRITQCQQNKL